MASDIVTIAREATLPELVETLISQGITGAPVVDNDQVVGVVSLTDLMVHCPWNEVVAPANDRYYREGFWLQLGPFRERLELLRVGDEKTVGEIMSTQLVTIAPDASVRELSHLMRNEKVHRVLVIENGEVMGIVTSMDMVALLGR